MADARVVIIGCGISGIAAALKLTRLGFKHVRVVEASHRAGGRVKSSSIGDKILEIGANWIHGPSQWNPVFRLACQYGLLDKESLSEENQTIDVQGHPPLQPTWLTSSGQKVDPVVAEPAVVFFMQLLHQCQRFHYCGDEPHPSVGQYVKCEVERVASEWQQQPDTCQMKLASVNTLLKLECCVNGTHSMDDVSLGSYGAYTTLPGLDCTFPRGYEGLIQCLMKELPNEVVSYNAPVKCVHWNSSDERAESCGRILPVLVECENGQLFPADHVIITVPLGYLKKHHDTLFRPALPPQKVESIQKMGFGTNNKVFLEFEEPFWEPDCEVIYLVWEEDSEITDGVDDVEKLWMKKLFGFTVLRPSERYGHVLCGWIAGHESEYMETLPDAEVMNTITQIIRRFTGNPNISPKRIVRSQWLQDKYTCGSYSYISTGCSTRDIDNITAPLPDTESKSLQVLFAGEATHKLYFSTVHGALLSGWREADRLIYHYNDSLSLSSKL